MANTGLGLTKAQIEKELEYHRNLDAVWDTLSSLQKSKALGSINFEHAEAEQDIEQDTASEQDTPTTPAQPIPDPLPMEAGIGITRRLKKDG